MKKKIFITLLLPFIICCSTKNTVVPDGDLIGGDIGLIILTPDRVVLKPIVDTVEVVSHNWIDISYGNNYPLGEEGIIDRAILPNKTQDTLVAEWIKAVAFNDIENKLATLKIISLEENKTGSDRSYAIHLGNGSNFGLLIATQLPE